MCDELEGFKLSPTSNEVLDITNKVHTIKLQEDMAILCIKKGRYVDAIHILESILKGKI